MTLFSYILAFDAGSAPNPFFRYCTLSICKPRIRRVAQPGDWIIATGPARHHTHRKLVYAMRISEVLPLEKYFRDPRFKRKKPDPGSKNWRLAVGDNLYRKNRDGSWFQRSGTHQLDNAQRDLSGKNALISTHFFYFGANAIKLPPSFQKLAATTQGHRSRFPDQLVHRFTRWLYSRHAPGIHGLPTDHCSSRH
jgi:hypothetical protein